jgi:hypothetical protein
MDRSLSILRDYFPYFNIFTYFSLFSWGLIATGRENIQPRDQNGTAILFSKTPRGAILTMDTQVFKDLSNYLHNFNIRFEV